MNKLFKICLTALFGTFFSSISFASSNFEENNSAFKQNVLYRIKNDENQSFLTFNTYGIAEFARDPQYSGKQITFNEFNLFYIVPTESGTTFNIMQNGAYLRYNGEKVTKESGSLFKINLSKHYIYDNKKHYYISADSSNGTKVINCVNAFDRNGDKNHVSLKKSDHTWKRHRTFLIEEYQPDHPEDQFNLGKLYLKIRNYNYAKKILQESYNNNLKNKEKITQVLSQDEGYVKYHILGKTIYSDNIGMTWDKKSGSSIRTTFIPIGKEIIIDESDLNNNLTYCELKNTPMNIMCNLLKADPFLTKRTQYEHNLVLIQYDDGRINISDVNYSLLYPGSAIRYLKNNYPSVKFEGIPEKLETSNNIKLLGLSFKEKN